MQKVTWWLKFGLKLGLTELFHLKSEKTKVNTELWFQTEVNLNNPVLNQTCTMHLDRQFCQNSSL